MTSPDELIAQGIEAARAGQRDVALQHFQAALRANPQNETAWLWLSGLVESPQQQRDCLQRVLAINPQNDAARRGLERLAQSEAASFLSAFAPHTPPPPPPPEAFQSASAPAAPPPAAFGTVAPAAETLGPVPIEFDSAAPPPAAPPSGPIELPPVSNITEAPCVFCGAPTGVNAQCDACGMEQVFDCPNCGRLLDLRETMACECGVLMQTYLVPGGIDRIKLGQAYADRDYPAAAVKQWKAALPTSNRQAALHRAIAEVYLNLGLIEQARMHNELSKQK